MFLGFFNANAWIIFRKVKLTAVFIFHLICLSLLEVKALKKKTCRGSPIFDWDQKLQKELEIALKKSWIILQKCLSTKKNYETKKFPDMFLWRTHY